MGMKYVKILAILLDRDYVNKKGLDLSKEVKKDSADQPGVGKAGLNRDNQQRMFLTSHFDNPWLCCLFTYKDPQYLFRKI